MKLAFFYYFLFLQQLTAMSQEKHDYIKISQELLYAVRTEKSFDSLQQMLTTASLADVQRQIQNDDKKKVFWLNIYNAYTQIALQENPGAYKNRNKFFSYKFINIGGKELSLDFVEHGILRRSKWKYSLGYFNKPFISKLEKQFRVQQLDYRIHFALNCGAKSCPPIAFYREDQIDKQLDNATRAYLKNETLFNGKDLTVQVPVILNWFRGDFGGKKGVIRLLQQKGIVPGNVKPGIVWKKYDWSLSLKAFE